ncbi:MAG TPA: hypothetical protein VMT76_05705 [Puia sp.]|nr:hypothetical protein [Puia sp.]
MVRKKIEWAVWLSRLLRWGFGGITMWAGIHYDYQWPVIIFGAIFFITGFFRPRRCVDDKCNV